MPKSETTLLALVGMSLAATFHVPADQLSAAWVTRNEPHAGAYWRLYRFFSGRLTASKYVEEGTFALTDDRVKLHWVERILGLLGFGMSFKTTVSIQSDKLISKGMREFLRGDFKRDALRVFDTMRPRTLSRKALCDTPAQTKSTIADAIGVFGITLTAATTPKKNAAKSYTASWVWNQEPTAAPIVLHPLDVLRNKGLRPFHHRGPASGPAELVTADARVGGQEHQQQQQQDQEEPTQLLARTMSAPEFKSEPRPTAAKDSEEKAVPRRSLSTPGSNPTPRRTTAKNGDEKAAPHASLATPGSSAREAKEMAIGMHAARLQAQGTAGDSAGGVYPWGSPSRDSHSWAFVPMIRAALFHENAQRVRLEAGPPRWDMWVAAYRQDFQLRGIVAGALAFERNGYLNARAQEWLLLGPLTPGGRSNVSDSVEGAFTAWIGQMTGHLAARNRGLLPGARALVFTPARHGRSNSEASLPTASTTPASNSSRSSSAADSSAQNPSPGSSRSSSSLPYSGDSLLHNLGSATAPICVTDTESSGPDGEEDDASQPLVKRSRRECFSALVAVPETQELCAAASARASTKRTRSEGAPAARHGLKTEASVNVGDMVEGVPCRQELGLSQPGSEEPALASPSIPSPAANLSPSSPDEVESPVAGSALSSPEEVATPGEAGQDDDDGRAPCRGRGTGAVAARLFDMAAQGSSGDSEDDDDDLEGNLSGDFIKDSDSAESVSEPEPRAPCQQRGRERSNRQRRVAVRRASSPLSQQPQRQPKSKQRLRKLVPDSDSEGGASD